jgi:hypothetical protein
MKLMFEVSYAGENHRDTRFISGVNNLFISHRTTWLDY